MKRYHIALLDVIEWSLPAQLPSAGALFMFFFRVKHIGQADPVRVHFTAAGLSAQMARIVALGKYTYKSQSVIMVL